MPSAEINNAARFARLHSKPIIDLNTADCIFAVKGTMARPQLVWHHPRKPQCHALGQSDRAQQAGSAEKWQEDLIARVFDCPVANEYGARDAGILAYTCPSGGIHITAENCIIEVLDPVTYEPVPNGQSGVLAITDLTNYVQPRLRYMLGDMGTLSTEECCCGRRLPLVPIIEKELLQRRKEQMQNQKLYRKSYDTNYLDFVFVNDMGTLFKPDYITRHFKELLQRNNLKVIRVHDLRHTCATMLCRQKISLRDIQLWLGHSTYQTTADIYTHLDYRDKLNTANAAADMVLNIMHKNA